MSRSTSQNRVLLTVCILLAMAGSQSPAQAAGLADDQGGQPIQIGSSPSQSTAFWEGNAQALVEAPPPPGPARALGQIIEDRRPSANEPLLHEEYFPVRRGEHIELGEPFDFRNVGGESIPESEHVAWELWDTDWWFHRKIASGNGYDFTYTFTDSRDVGRVKVRFYVDLNQSGDKQDGEPWVDSAKFHVRPLRAYVVNVKYSDKIAAPPTALGVLQYFNDSAGIARRRDAADDQRACVTFNVPGGTFGSYTPTADPCSSASQAANEADRVADTTQAVADAQVRLLSDLGGYLDPSGQYWIDIIGSTPLGAYPILIDWNDRTAVTFIHEFGHRRGLRHDGHPPAYIMTDGPDANSVRLFADDAVRYE
jgi:opacity protein-like surface antigen